MSDIADRVSNVVVSKLHIPANKVTQGASFINDFAATSLDVVETIMSLEDEFGIEISDRDHQKLQTVGDVSALIRTKVHRDIPTAPPSTRATPDSSSGSRRS